MGGGSVGGGSTVTVRVAGVASARPWASVTAKLTVKVPAVAKVSAPGSSAVEGATPEAPKSHRYVSGRSPSGSLPVPAKLTVSPAVIVGEPTGASIVLSGAWLGGGATGGCRSCSFE